MKKWIVFLATTLALSSCIYKFTPELETDVKETLVVDGKILVGGISTVQLSYLLPLGTNAQTSVPFGRVWIEDDLGNIYRPQSGQEYGSSFNIPTAYSTHGTDINKATEFRAVAEVDGKTYSSAWLTPDPAPEITQINFVANETDVQVMVDLKTGVNDAGFYGFMIEEDWEFHSDYYPQYFIDPNSWTYYQPIGDYPFYWCFRHSSPQRMFLLNTQSLQTEGGLIRNIPVQQFARTDSRNHRKYSIMVSAFALSKEAYDFTDQLQEISDVGGDLFTPDPGALGTNMVCESHPEASVMGMVLAGRVTGRRAFLRSIYLISRNPGYSFQKVTQENMPYMYYEMNFRPITDALVDNESVIGWGPHRCINCLEAGGTQEKPVFWDNEQ